MATDSMSRCCVRGCPSVKTRQPWKWQPSFHVFPLDEIVCAKWVAFCDNPYLAGRSAKELHSKRHICGLHFPSADKITNNIRTSIVSKRAVPVLNPPPLVLKIIKPLTRVAVAQPNPQPLQNNAVVVSLEDFESDNMDIGAKELTTKEVSPEETPQTFMHETQPVDRNSQTVSNTKFVNEFPRIFFSKTTTVQQHVHQDVIDDEFNNTCARNVTVETSTAISDNDDIPDDEIDCGLKDLQKRVMMQTTREAADDTIRKKRSKNIKNDPALVYDELKRQRTMNRKLRITCTQLKNRCIAERAARKNYLKHLKKYATKEQYQSFLAEVKNDSRPLLQPKKRKRVLAQPSQKQPSEAPAMQQLSTSSQSSAVTANPGVIHMPSTPDQGQLVRLVVISGAQQCFPFNFDALKKAS